MSHTIRSKVKIQDQEILARAAERLGFRMDATVSTHSLYGSTRVDGIGIHIPVYAYPVVLTSDGTLVYDTWTPGEGYKSENSIHRLTHEYSVLKTIADASILGVSAVAGETVQVGDMFVTDITTY